MAPNTAGIDPHQDTYTAAVVDPNGVELDVAVFDNTAGGYGDTIDWLTTHRVQTADLECSGSWGARGGHRRVGVWPPDRLC